MEDKVDKIIKNPKKALFKLAWPIIIGMTVQIAYNISDTAFVGHLGSNQIAALTFSFPLFFIFTALTVGLGTGVGSRISRYVGAKNTSAAENTAIHGLLISLVVALMIFGLGKFSLAKIFLHFGATEEVIKLGIEYMTPILFGLVFMFPNFVINSIFSGQGDTKTPMKIQVASITLNIILDPILIYGFGYGIKGAAYATVISVIFTFILFSIYVVKKSQLKLELNKFRYSNFLVKEILKVGVPSSMMMLIISIYMVILNRFMAHFGTDYVSAWGIIFRLESVALMPLIGLAMAMMNLIGILVGAKKTQEIKSTIWYGIKKAIFFASLVALIFFIVPEIFLRIFTSEEPIIALSKPFLRLDVITFPLMAVSMMIARSMQGMGYGLPGFVIQLVRTILVVTPLSYILVFVFGYGYLSVAISMFAGGVVANIIGIIWVDLKLKKLQNSH
jgi:putative MATE family efflux protein